MVTRVPTGGSCPSQDLRESQCKGVEFVDIFIKDTKLKAKEFVAEYEFTFPTGLDSEAKLATEYKVFGPPVKFFISRDGHIVERVSGPMKEDDLMRTTSALPN
jgi:peroxiredoxin